MNAVLFIVGQRLDNIFVFVDWIYTAIWRAMIINNAQYGLIKSYANSS